MATASTGWKCTHATSTSSNTDTSIKITVACYWQNDGWNYDMNNVSAWVYCNGESYKVKDNSWLTAPSNSGKYSLGSHTFTISKGTSAKSISCYAKITSASSYVSGTKSSTATTVSVSAKTSYTVKYNANGGSGAPSSQTKWYDTNLTLSSTKPTRTGYTFQGWGTSASDTSVNYTAGATYSANAAITLYAIWKANTYTVKYNANGGSGAPANQTKTYGVTLTLSSTKPTRTNYNFKGWATSASGSVKYAAGASYTTNAAVTLYAVWELAYTKPRITNFSAQRCNSAGTIDETGTYILFKFNWATDKEVSSIIVDWGTDPNWTSGSYSNFTITASGTSGSISQVVGDGTVSIETTYYGRSYVKDSGGWSRSNTVTIATTKFPIDVKVGGTGVAIGKVAEEDDLLDVGHETKFRKNATVEKSTGASYFRARRSDTGTSVWMGVGDSGDNNGLYNNSPLNKWIVVASSTYVRLNGIPDSNVVASSATTTYLGTDSGVSDITTYVRGNNVRFYAHSGGGVYLGSSGSTAVTSDENLKDINEIDEKYIEFFKNLKPITYIYKNKGHRNHMGFGARQVEQALKDAGLTTEQFAGVLIDKDLTIYADENGTEEDVHYDEMYSLRYEEFIALNTMMIQKQAEEIKSLREEIGILKAKLG